MNSSEGLRHARHDCHVKLLIDGDVVSRGRGLSQCGFNVTPVHKPWVQYHRINANGARRFVGTGDGSQVPGIVLRLGTELRVSWIGE